MQYATAVLIHFLHTHEGFWFQSSNSQISVGKEIAKQQSSSALTEFRHTDKQNLRIYETTNPTHYINVTMHIYEKNISIAYALNTCRIAPTNFALSVCTSATTREPLNGFS